jgi:hypothetical protein
MLRASMDRAGNTPIGFHDLCGARILPKELKNDYGDDRVPIVVGVGHDRHGDHDCRGSGARLT